MNIRFGLVLLVLSLFGARSNASAQTGAPAPKSISAGAKDSLNHLPGRALLPGHGIPKKVYADSVEFEKAFAEVFQIVKPKESIKERTTHQFVTSYARFKSHGVDSLAAWKAVVAVIDTNHDHEALFDTYRSIFSAEELRAYTKFLKTPAGKKVYDSQQRLSTAPMEFQGYVTRMIMSTIMPMARAADPQMRPAAPAAVTNKPPTAH